MDWWLHNDAKGQEPLIDYGQALSERTEDSGHKNLLPNQCGGISPK
jgi:hypothetical protein